MTHDHSSLARCQHCHILRDSFIFFDRNIACIATGQPMLFRHNFVAYDIVWVNVLSAVVKLKSPENEALTGLFWCKAIRFCMVKIH